MIGIDLLIRNFFSRLFEDHQDNTKFRLIFIRNTIYSTNIVRILVQLEMAVGQDSIHERVEFLKRPVCRTRQTQSGLIRASHRCLSQLHLMPQACHLIDEQQGSRRGDHKT